jgi:hypothetical protein
MTVHTDLVFLFCTVINDTEFLDNHGKWKEIGGKGNQIGYFFSPWSISYIWCDVTVEAGGAGHEPFNPSKFFN